MVVINALHRLASVLELLANISLANSLALDIFRAATILTIDPERFQV